MKREGNLYSQIYDLGNLYLAHQNARKGKGWYRDVAEVDSDAELYLEILRQMFINHEYQTSEYEVFDREEGGKVRRIYKLPYFPDRIGQWAIIQIIEPYLLKTFIIDTYSALPGKGIHFGLRRVKKAIAADKEGCKYCLKLDIHHYYQSIDHEILKSKYRRLFKDKDLLWVLDEIIDSVSTSDSGEQGVGIPIGNYLSQYSGNLYLSDFDHWIKEQKHVKHYFRYMDDIVILSSNKIDLQFLFQDIKDYFTNNLKLTIKSNYQIFPTYIRGVDFLGYRIFENFVLLRKSTCKKMKRKMRIIKKKINNGGYINYSENCSINSYLGWTKHCNSYRLNKKYINPLVGKGTD